VQTENEIKMHCGEGNLGITYRRVTKDIILSNYVSKAPFKIYEITNGRYFSFRDSNHF